MSETIGGKKVQVNQFQILFTSKKITAYGGFSLLAKFFEKIGLPGVLSKVFPVKETSPNALGAYPKALSFLLMLFAGGKRFSHILYLGESKDLLAGLFGVRRLPKASSTLTRFFGNIKTWKAIESFHEKLWPFLLNVISWDKIKEDNLTFDSHVAVRFGKQAGAKIGYNIKKPGRPSHHPLIGFLNQSRFVVNLWNRPGNASSAHNILAFLDQTLLRLKNRLKIRTVFADSGFYELPFFQSLEERKIPYVVAVKLHQVIQKIFFSKTLIWNEVALGIEMAEFLFKHDNWEKKRRYFVIREKCQTDKAIIGKQLSLFPDHELNKNYRYRAYITNSDLDIKVLWDRYRTRADDENRIKELVEDFGLDGFCLRSFYATEAAMVTGSLMYNLFNLFRSEILSGSESTERASTIRYKYWTIPAIAGRSGNQWLLRLGAGSKKLRAKIEYLFSRIIEQFSLNEKQLQCS